MEQEIVISIKNLSKTFTIDNNQETIKTKIQNIFFPSKNSSKGIKVLKDISFDIYRGDFVRITGPNGAGKSTLLKIILGAIKPDSNSIINTKGKIMRLSLGMGFDGNLSVRDNIYVNGSIIGLNFIEIGNRFEEIIDFAEIQKFIDVPLKYLSNGMKSRLAFSIVVQADADILLIDEFFGIVGDKNFRIKSQKKFQEFLKDKSKTVVLVSHNENISGITFNKTINL